MKPANRHKKIISWLQATNKEWHIEEFAEKFKVSHLTIRRDLNSLAQEGVIIRTHGGCIIDERSNNTIYHKVIELNFELKQKIGIAASRLINPYDIVLVADGSTNFHLATQLKNCGPATVYTNSLSAFTQLCHFSNLTLYLLGGKYDINNEMIFLRGELTENMLETLNFDIVFVGTDAIDKNGNCLLKNEEIARTNKIILDRGRKKILLADHTKIGAVGNNTFANLTDFDEWITTAGVPLPLLKTYRTLTTIKEVKPDPSIEILTRTFF